MTYKMERKACEELGTQLEHRKAFAAKVKDEEDRKVREHQKRKEEQRLHQEKLKIQKEDEEKRKQWKQLQDKEQQKNEKKTTRKQQGEEADRNLGHGGTKWDELRNLQVGESHSFSSVLSEPLKPAPSSSTIANENLAAKKKAPKPPLPYNSKKRPPVITVTTQSPSPTTIEFDSWEANFKGITTVASYQDTTTATTPIYSNVTITTATVTPTSTTSSTQSNNNVIEDLATATLDDVQFSSAPDDILTKSTHVSASVELV